MEECDRTKKTTKAGAEAEEGLETATFGMAEAEEFGGYNGVDSEGYCYCENWGRQGSEGVKNWGLERTWVADDDGGGGDDCGGASLGDPWRSKLTRSDLDL